MLFGLFKSKHERTQGQMNSQILEDFATIANALNTQVRVLIFL